MRCLVDIVIHNYYQKHIGQLLNNHRHPYISVNSVFCGYPNLNNRVSDDPYWSPATVVTCTIDRCYLENIAHLT